jgi:hypothetical protein
MNHALQVELVRRVLDHIAHRTTDRAGGPTRLPTRAYTDPVRHEHELQHVFGDRPLAIGHSSQLPAPGDFFTHDSSGMPLLVVHGDDGHLAAFLNVCRHRGTRLELAPGGTCKAFVCPFHDDLVLGAFEHALAHFHAQIEAAARPGLDRSRDTHHAGDAAGCA